MTGAVPNTRWLRGLRRARRQGLHQDRPGPVARRPRRRRLAAGARRRTCSRPACPGVFAVGDVRGGNIKRVASAVGEGSIAVAFVHQVLHE